ncbi:MAG TPA: SDR family NAD(P)-dependent oxidoreductase [Elusimicrobiales bacterium]|nr:SDR family NAD(P)-dependent oxidoreductase [Elusimicrobiales bacterium]
MSQNVSKKKVIIIGASSGIGKCLAKVFSEHGYAVGITARRLELLSEAAKECPSDVFIKQMDVSNPVEAMGILEEIIKEMGGVDTVVINAGVGFDNQDLIWEKENKTIGVNVIGFTAIANVAMKHFLKQKSGHLVGISSIAAIRGNPSAPAYNASKAFISNYLEAMRLKAIKSKIPITVTDIQPGFVGTAMAQGEGTFWVTSAKQAATQIFNAIRKKKKHAYVTRRWRIIAWLFRIMPDWILAKIL